ncbi:sugar ABC transporter ATP-binding protein [Alkalicoccobacillus murimartini]|uniref:Ribose transport system ATP-binding protein n=1 Tax=Alkalicoccobacillus murimartini TaxID=171685 RepID=A0ABT9YH68_9BACI|nr:sugar ABC transporter ATP-binding protein [Alkalicoccobacillus murimartini]MDQ0207205.1 ribose transport system ATP-binding protein [Alkalicoccobacillus murimartini]
MSEPLLQVIQVKKSFSGTEVLKGLDLDVEAGEVHVLLGENGAGKSTLIKMLTGAYSMDEGEMYWQGEKVTFETPSDSMNVGIATIYQELNMIPELKVYENIFLGNERHRFSMLNRKHMKRKARELLIRLGQNPDLIEKRTGSLGIGLQQIIEIAKALTTDAKLLIMDEPTSSLSGTEVEQLFASVKELRKEGLAIIFISHRLEEIKELGDRVTILRDGLKVETLPVKETISDKMVELMVGRTLNEKFPKIESERGKEGLRVDGLQIAMYPEPLSFSAYQGEILGLAGLVGAGRTELARAIFGADPKTQGSISIFGQEMTINSPKDAIQAGLAFITEDRKGEGLVLGQTLRFNINLGSLFKYKQAGVLKKRALYKNGEHYVQELNIQPAKAGMKARFLSGGNQQKVVIAKWLSTDAEVFIFDEPTRGIDVGAKVEVYRLMNELIEKGKIVVVISSELPELLGMCDRILVMHEGTLTGDFDRETASQERIMRAATGGK